MLGQTYRFLHISDIHLGCRQYNAQEREQDFYLAFDSVVQRYALPLEEDGMPQVDFVILGGDLFDTRHIEPITLSRAEKVLEDLKDAGIPVFAIEGNHDQKRRNERASWYNYLSDSKLMVYLRDYQEEGELVLAEWDGWSGSYFNYYNDGSVSGEDYEDVGVDQRPPVRLRIVGSRWYGATAQNMLARFPDVLDKLPSPEFTIMIFHGGLTDYVNELSAGVEYEQFVILRDYVDYLALGHIHKRYDRQNWLFNPGSLEACKLQEFFEENGAYRITVNEEGIQEVEHCTDYRRRPFVFVRMDCDMYQTPEELEEAIKDRVKREGMSSLQAFYHQQSDDLEKVPPICYLDFRGTLGFPFSQIDMKAIEAWIRETLSAQLFRYRNDTLPLEYGQEDEYPERDGRLDRERLEKQIFHNLFLQDTRYRSWAPELAEYAAVLKKRLLEKQDLEDEEQQQYLKKLEHILQQEPSVATLEEEEELGNLQTPTTPTSTDEKEEASASSLEEAEQNDHQSGDSIEEEAATTPSQPNENTALPS